MKRTNKGFTLMELLIVIGVLGILAAGLLAAIDPFEQLKKARDTNNRSATIELLSSLTRYYASHGAFPWNMPAYAATGICSRVAGQPLAKLGALGTTVMDVQDATNFQPCITGTLLVDGELKSTFFTGIGATHIYVASDPTDLTNVQVCFAPEGKSARSDPSTSYLVAGTMATTLTVTDQTGVSGALCPNAALSTCLQCFK
jgi:prepilin-type N-terminal cleavage/methylation domain-containing protein